MVPEGAGGAELAELVADHRLGDVHRDVLATVVNGDGGPDQAGEEGAAAGPGIDDLAFPSGVLGVVLLEQVLVDERAILVTASLCVTLLPLPGFSDGPGRSDDDG